MTEMMLKRKRVPTGQKILYLYSTNWKRNCQACFRPFRFLVLPSAVPFSIFRRSGRASGQGERQRLGQGGAQQGGRVGGGGLEAQGRRQ